MNIYPLPSATGPNRPLVIDIYAVGYPRCADCQLVEGGGLFWQPRGEIYGWLNHAFEYGSYEVRLNDLHSDLPEYERVITHHTYIVLYGYSGVTPQQQAMMFKLAWGGE